MKTSPSNHYTLPALDLPDSGEPVIVLTVLAHPELGYGRSLTWIVDKQPSRRIGYGQLVSLRTSSSGSSGTGMLTSVTDLRRHWITWTVASGAIKCRVRVPISWSVMHGVEAIAHAKHYHILPSTPPPHRDDPVARIPSHSTSYPYQHDITPEEQQHLSEKLEGITRKKWHWGGGASVKNKDRL